MEHITSRENNNIKNAVSLRKKSARYEMKQMFFEGRHLLEEYLRAGHMPLKVFVLESVYDKYAQLLSRVDEDKTFLLSPSVYEKITTEKSPQGIFTIAQIPVRDGQKPFDGGYIILDSLQDPGNAGSIIRTAACLGLNGVIMGGGCADIYSHKTIRASMGAVFHLNTMYYEKTEDAVCELTSGGKRVFATALYGKFCDIMDIDIDVNDSFVIGNEGNGISENVLKKCSASVKIDITDRAESLGAASAASIIMWEMKRSRLYGKHSI